jgi:hypothetical protein
MLSPKVFRACLEENWRKNKKKAIGMLTLY